MDYFFLVASGIVIGAIVAAPIGPVNLICIRRTLAYGPLNGFLSGLGAAAGDSVFAVVTAFGLTAIAQLVEGYSIVLQLVSGLMLIGFGWLTFRADPSCGRDSDGLPAKDGGPATLLRAIVSTFALTITNPATLFGFAALFAGLGSLTSEDAPYLAAAVTVAGVFAGSAGWWFTITTIVGIFHRRIDTPIMRRINHFSGIAVICFGLAVLGHLAVSRLL